ncbi:MAG: hypothetical protein H8D67_08070, partial [Deltaproteobacteria bacterium]|nr:hypothetical protein [Deltaproteobacteria bacterium]
MAKGKDISSTVTRAKKYPPPHNFSKKAHIKTLREYQDVYRRSVNDPEGFWAEMADELSWFKKWEKV